MTTRNLTFQNDPSFTETRDDLIGLVYDNVKSGHEIFNGMIETLMGLIYKIKPAVLIDEYIDSTGLLNSLNRQFEGDFVLIGKFIVNLSLLQERIEKERDFLRSVGYTGPPEAKALVESAGDNQRLHGFILGFPISAIESYNRAQEARAHGPDWTSLLLASEDKALATKIRFEKIPPEQRERLNELNEEYIAMLKDVNASASSLEEMATGQRALRKNFLNEHKAYLAEILRSHFNVTEDDIPYLIGDRTEIINMPGYNFVTESPEAADVLALREMILLTLRARAKT